MTHLDQVLDPAELGQMLDEGYVQVRYHPDYPLAIYCYTKKAMFDRKWNNTTRTCRGLIVNEDTGQVVARPFKKFFNVGEPDAPVFEQTDWVTAYDKLDGSLGIAYETPDGPAIATKGSFTSDQALAATELLRGQYGRYQVDQGITDLFEIILPENRIVLDYGDERSLRYLGSVFIDDGSDYWSSNTTALCGIPVNHFLDSGPMYQLELNLNRPNAEGFVLFNDDTGERLKLKQQDYLELHRVMTGLNERQIWGWLSEGKYSKDILPSLPEELHPWVSSVINDLIDNYLRKMGEVVLAFRESKYLDRKEFALFNAGKPNWVRGALFAKYDGNHDRVEEIIWKAVRP